MGSAAIMVAVALVSFASLLLELAMTRLFSVVLKPTATRIAGIRGYAFAVAMAGASFPLMPANWHPAAGRTLH